MLLKLPNNKCKKRRKSCSYLKRNSLKQKKYNRLNNERKQNEEYRSALQERIELEDIDPVIFKVENEESVHHPQDELKNNTCKCPKIAITTSKMPSERLLIFIKELRLIFPNSECLARGSYEMSQIIYLCRASGFTDLIVIHEYMEVPDSLVICHLPYGLTTSFTLSGVIMHHEMPIVARMSAEIPHVVFQNFRSYLSVKIMRILKYLLPETNMESQRVIMFTHEDGYISFRQHNHKKAGDVEPKEAGPRFQLKLLEMKIETPEELDAADAEWVLRPYLNTSPSYHNFQKDLDKYRLYTD